MWGGRDPLDERDARIELPRFRPHGFRVGRMLGVDIARDDGELVAEDEASFADQLGLGRKTVEIDLAP